MGVQVVCDTCGETARAVPFVKQSGALELFWTIPDDWHVTYVSGPDKKPRLETRCPTHRTGKRDG